MRQIVPQLVFVKKRKNRLVPQKFLEQRYRWEIISWLYALQQAERHAAYFVIDHQLLQAESVDEVEDPGAGNVVHANQRSQGAPMPVSNPA